MTKAVVLFSVLVLGWTWTLLGICAQGEIHVDGQVSDNVAPAVDTTLFNKTEICALAPETGPCRAFVERYFYNPSSKNCEIFIYGGCSGNRNNFENATVCMQKCHSNAHGQGEELDSDELTEHEQ